MAPRCARILRYLLAVALALAPAAAMAETPAQGELERALAEARAGDWTGASAFAGRIGDRVASDIVLWTRLREGSGGFAEYEAFLARNGDWPGLTILRRQGERKMPVGHRAANVVAFFGGEAPQTGTGALRLADALTARGRVGEAQAVIVRNWPELRLSRDEQTRIVGRFGPALASRHVARLDNLLWQGRMTEAEAMLPLVDGGWQALARARIGLRRDVAGTTALIDAVPRQLQSDPGLAYERFLWRVDRGLWDEAEEWMQEHSRSAAALGRPEMWMGRRPGLVRRALRRGDVDAAYRLAAQSFGSQGAEFAESEWLAGFIALTRLDDPHQAVRHFRRFEAAVATPISLGRAGFWLGLAHERAGNSGAARQAFAAAARHQTSFYGQLAAERAGARADARLAGNSVPDWRGNGFMRNPVVQAGYLLHLAGDDGRAMLFFRHAAERMTASDRAALAQMQLDLDRPHIGLRLAKDAASQGIIIPAQYYPMHDLARRQWPVPAEFAMAVARQESEFNAAAVSHAGARGLMQLMPGTAQEVSRGLGLDYDAGQLITDPMYNARLGTTYLSQMLSNYGGSYLLAAAAYNAGPGRVRQWLREYGDPRRSDVDAVVWIESIPFNETRNYVMRVLEGLHVYRARINGRAQPIRLVADINRTG